MFETREQNKGDEQLSQRHLYKKEIFLVGGNSFNTADTQTDFLTWQRVRPNSFW